MIIPKKIRAVLMLFLFVFCLYLVSCFKSSESAKSIGDNSPVGNNNFNKDINNVTNSTSDNRSSGTTELLQWPGWFMNGGGERGGGWNYDGGFFAFGNPLGEDTNFGRFSASEGSCRFQLVSIRGRALEIMITEVDGLSNLLVGDKYTFCTDWAISDNRSVLTLSGCSFPGTHSGTINLKDKAYD